MATFVVGAILAAALFFALRRIYRNMASGRCECLDSACSGCGGKNGACTGCHSKL